MLRDLPAGAKIGILSASVSSGTPFLCCFFLLSLFSAGLRSAAGDLTDAPGCSSARLGATAAPASAVTYLIQKPAPLQGGFLCSSFELFTRLELVTSSLPRKCSTTELKQHFLIKSDAKVHKKNEKTKKLYDFREKFLPLLAVNNLNQ